MIEGASILGAGVLLGVVILLLVEHLGTPKFAAPSTQTRTTIPDPNARTEPPDGAAKLLPRPPIKTMNGYLRKIEAAIPKMPPARAQALMEKLRRGAY